VSFGNGALHQCWERAGRVSQLWPVPSPVVTHDEEGCLFESLSVDEHQGALIIKEHYLGVVSLKNVKQITGVLVETVIDGDGNLARDCAAADANPVWNLPELWSLHIGCVCSRCHFSPGKVSCITCGTQLGVASQSIREDCESSSEECRRIDAHYEK
jgi:hypothetical protein